MENVPEGVDRVVSHRVGERDGDGVIVGHHRHHAVLLRDVGGNLLDHFGVDRVGIYVAVLEPELVGDRAENLVLANRAAGYENVKSRLVLGLHRLRGRIDLILGQEPAFDQDLDYILVVACHLFADIIPQSAEYGNTTCFP